MRSGKGRGVDVAKAHIVTLWCAVVAKANRGVAKLLPRQMTQLQLRLLEQLTLPESEHARPVRIARLLALKPADVDEAVPVLADQGLLEVCGDDCVELTEAGRERAALLAERLDAFFALCVEGLSNEERAILSDLLRRALARPGSYYARASLAGGMPVALDARHGLALVAMLHGAAQTAIKKATSLSFTDFRFLLELYPKRRTGARMLRARDMVSFLRTGRAYVTTASVRLEEQGYLVRVPDAHDARGILFKLTPQGTLCVQDVAEDLYAVLVSMFGEAVEDRAVQRVLRHLLELEDGALDRLADLSW